MMNEVAIELKQLQQLQTEITVQFTLTRSRWDSLLEALEETEASLNAIGTNATSDQADYLYAIRAEIKHTVLSRICELSRLTVTENAGGDE